MWVATCAASCCASCACEGCKALASSISRRSARVAYCFLFTMSLIVAWVMRDFAEPVLESIPWIDHIVQTPDKEWFHTQAVLRVSFASFLFFLAFALIMIGVKDTSDQRDSWHHGGWMIKFIVWAVLIVLSFLLPNGLVNAYGSMARFGSGLFLLIQVLILLDFTHHWNAAWVEKDETFWYVALLSASAVCYTITFVLSGFLFHWFAASAEGCELNTFFITVTLLLAVAFTVVSLHPQINGSLLPAAVISMYCMYLSYTALSSEPRDYECNGLHKHTAAVSTGTMVMGMMTTLLSVAYSAVRAGSSTTFLSPPSSPRAGNRKPLLTEKDMEEDPEMDDSREMKMTRGSSKKDSQPVSYVYSFFHLIFAMASMYSAMLLTGWGNSNIDQDVVDVGWSSVWVRIITQWITAILYIWSLVAPHVLPDRDFS